MEGAAATWSAGMDELLAAPSGPGTSAGLGTLTAHAIDIAVFLEIEGDIVVVEIEEENVVGLEERHAVVAFWEEEAGQLAMRGSIADSAASRQTPPAHIVDPW